MAASMKAVFFGSVFGFSASDLSVVFVVGALVVVVVFSSFPQPCNVKVTAARRTVRAKRDMRVGKAKNSPGWSADLLDETLTKRCSTGMQVVRGRFFGI